MASPGQQPITDDQLQGFKYFELIGPLLDRLHDHATQRDRAGNRTLHFDQYLALQLLFFFNPIVVSTRGIIQASHLDKVRKKLGVCSTSLGRSPRRPASVFDAELIKPIIAELHGQLRPLKHDGRLGDLPGVLTAVDGTELTALANLTGRLIEGRDLKSPALGATRQGELHTHFEPLSRRGDWTWT